MAESGSSLADLYVQFSARGDKELDKSIDSKRARLMAAAGAANSFAKGVAGAAASAADKLGSLGQKALFVGGILKGIVLGKGLANTVEMDSLSQSFENLAGSIADVFAPVIRGVIQTFLEMTTWFMSLDSQTKGSIVTWTLLATALGGVLAILPVLKVGISLLGNAFALMSTKIVLIPALILGVIAALLYLTAEGDSFEERSVSVLSTVIRFWTGLKSVMLTVWEVLKAIGKGLYRVVTGDLNGAFEAISSELKAGIKRVWEEGQKQYDEAPRTARNVIDAVKNITAKVTDLGATARDLAGNDTALGRIMKAFSDNRPLQIKAQMVEGPKSGQQMWEDALKKAIGSNFHDLQRQQAEEQKRMRMGIDKINHDGVRVRNTGPVVSP